MGVTLDRVKTTIRAAANAVSDAMRIGYADPDGTKISWPGIGSWPKGMGWKRDRTGNPGWLDILLESLEEEIDPKKLGACTLAVTAPTTCVAGTWIKAAGITAAGILDGFTHGVSNRLVYAHTVPKNVMVHISLTVISTTVNVILDAAIAKNGTPIGASQIHRKISTAGDAGAWHVHWPIAMAENDHTELWLRCDSGSTITVQEMTLTAQEV